MSLSLITLMLSAIICNDVSLEEGFMDSSLNYKLYYYIHHENVRSDI